MAACLVFASCERPHGAGTTVEHGAAENNAPVEAIASEPLPPEPVEAVFKGKVASGNTAASILNAWLSPAEVHAFAGVCEPVYDLTKIRVGKPYRVATLDDRFERFEYMIDADSYLEVSQDGESYKAAIKPIAYDVKTVTVTGEIRTSLYEAMTAVGEKPSLAVRLGNLLGWEIDFIHDLRVGDTFSVLVEKRYAGGVFKGYGRILAADFTNRGVHYEAYRMESEDGTAQ